MREVIESSATISEDGLYRYELQRRWGEGSLMVWVMLNPSTADAEVDDPTIRRCISFSKRSGWSGIHVVNVMAFRATSPKECLAAEDPFGPRNHGYLRAAIMFYGEGKVVCAWGAKAPENYVRLALTWLRPASLLCLGTTKNGSPRHPLYVRSDTLFERFSI